MNYLLSCILVFALIGGLKAQQQVPLLLPEANADILLGELPVQSGLSRSVELIRQTQQAEPKAMAELRELGRRLMRSGKHEYAREAFDKLLDLHNKAHGPEDLRSIRALIDLARVNVLLIRYEVSLSLYEEVLTKLKKQQLDQGRDALAVQMEMMQIYLFTQENRQAYRLGQKLDKQLKEAKQDRGLDYALVLNNFAIARARQGELKEALANYEEALRLIRQGKQDKYYELTVLGNYAELLARSERQSEARTLLREHLPWLDKHLSRKATDYARVWMLFGHALAQIEEYETAEYCFRKGLATNSLTFKEVGDIPAQVNDLLFNNEYLAICAQAGTLMTTSGMYEQRFKRQGDYQALEQAYRIIWGMGEFEREMQSRLTSEQDKLVFFQLGAALAMYRGLNMAHKLYEQSQKPIYLEQGFEFSERLKSTLLMHALRGKSEQERLGELPQALRQEELALEQTLRDLQKRFLETSTGEQRTAIRSEINTQQRKIELFKTQLREKHPEYYQLRHRGQSVTIPQVQARLDARTALISFSLSEEGGHAFVIRQNGVEFIGLPGHNPTTLKKLSQDLRRSLSDYPFLRDAPSRADSLYRTSAQALYELYFAPALENLGSKIERLVIVPDAELGHLPLEVLLTEAPMQALDYGAYPYLLRRYAISYAYSAALFAEKGRPRPEPANKGVLAFAAEYGADTADLPEALLAQRRRGLGELRKSLQPLPGAEKEVQLMKRYLLGEFFLGKEAGEKNFKAKARDYNVIHLAMHGLLNNSQPVLSSMAFSEDVDAEEDNFLHAYEIAKLDLNARLVVLSACETGFGKFRQGEGVMSLAHAFAYAGARSVVMSLWQVNDASTGLIMEYFYRNLAAGMDKDEALRQAKLRFLNSADELVQHPAYWAAFVQTGDTEPIELYCEGGFSYRQTRQWTRWGLMGLAGLAVLGLGYWFWSRRA